MATTQTRTEARLAELEIKISYAEDLLDELNRSVFRQQREIELLAGELKRLGKQITDAAPTQAHSLRDDIPPHY
ncbi:MAG: SlyX family protein [Azonexus sp.]|jgi:SlyX protein|nr:SlyX family protein [Azonexus sp.]